MAEWISKAIASSQPLSMRPSHNALKPLTLFSRVMLQQRN